MPMKNFIQTMILQIRGPFLILSVVLVAIGAAAASRVVPPVPVNIILILAGVILAHISVNLFNEISDYQTGIDSNTTRTPFSGGSGMLQTGVTSVKTVTIAAYGSLLSAGLIGIYFTFVSGWLILLFMIAGGLSVRFYTSHLAKIYLGEIGAGITLGTLVILGTFYALTGLISFQVLLLAIPPGLLTSLLLFLNEFPDAGADKQGGRRNLVLLLGKRKSSAVYAIGLICVYSLIAFSAFYTGAPQTILISLATIPIAIKAVLITEGNYNSIPELIPALGLNVAVIILTDLLIAIGLVM
ncbi:prenyltransferase [bacterium]|nr:prenyltransferase [bacterium]